MRSVKHIDREIETKVEGREKYGTETESVRDRKAERQTERDRESDRQRHRERQRKRA